MENCHALSPGGNNEALRFISTEVLVGRFSHVSTCQPTARGNLLNGFAISRQFTHEYIAGSLKLLPFADPVFRQPDGQTLNCPTYTGFISDHLPLVAKFQVATDDD